MKPIIGMTKDPYGLPEMLLAWQDCLLWTASIEGFVEAFKREMGIDLNKLTRRSPLEKMIDKSTGFERDAIIKWCDWVTENIWGLID